MVAPLRRNLGFVRQFTPRDGGIGGNLSNPLVLMLALLDVAH